MASAGDVTINFAAETAKFTAELKKVRAELKTLRESTDGIVSSVKGFGTALKTAFISAGVVAGIHAIVKATEESEAAISQLDAALKNASSTVRLSSAEFLAFSKSMQATTTFTDEAVTGVETVLLSFRSLSGQTILSATSAVLDLSTRLGTDLTSAAKLVGRALEDPVKGMTALGRAGVVLSQSQQSMIKSLVAAGQTAQAQGIILAELEKRYGGAAAAARDTLGGAIKGLQNALGDLLEGDKGSFSGATKSINDLTKTLTSPDLKRGFDALITGLAAVVSVAAKAASAIASFGKAEGDLFSRFLVPGAFLSASQALQAELTKEQNILQGMQLPRARASEEEIAQQKAYIETLKQRIELAKQVEAVELRRAQIIALQPVATTVSPIAGPEDKTLEELKRQENFLELREKIITNSINSAGAQLDVLDRQLGDGEHTLTQLSEIARRERAKSLKEFTDNELGAASKDVDRQIRLQQDLTDRTIEEQQKRAENENRVQQDMKAVRERAVFDSIGVLSFLVAGHNKAYKAVAAVHKAFTLLQIYRDTAAAATLALRTYPPPFGYAAAAAAIGFGAIQAAAVLSDRPPRSSGRSAAFDTSSTAVSSTQTAIASQPLGAQQKPQSTINVYGWSEAAIRELVKVMKREISDHDLTIIRQS